MQGEDKFGDRKLTIQQKAVLDKMQGMGRSRQSSVSSPSAGSLRSSIDSKTFNQGKKQLEIDDRWPLEDQFDFENCKIEIKCEFERIVDAWKRLNKNELDIEMAKLGKTTSIKSKTANNFFEKTGIQIRKSLFRAQESTDNESLIQKGVSISSP